MDSLYITTGNKEFFQGAGSDKIFKINKNEY